MIKTYIMCSRQFEDKAVFLQALESVSSYRRRKIELLRHESDKNRSLAAALALNAALKDYDLEERKMEYAAGEQGKPFFCDHPEIRFSLSHSGDYAICSIGTEEIGNDIEWVRGKKERVAERFFAAKELAWIQSAESLAEKDARIFRIWTMKESFLKVTGLGMSLPLKDFTILMENDKPTLYQQLNAETYHIKEYQIPSFCNEKTDYKISVCSTDQSFSPKIDVVGLS